MAVLQAPSAPDMQELCIARLHMLAQGGCKPDRSALICSSRACLHWLLNASPTASRMACMSIASCGHLAKLVYSALP